MTLKIGIVGGGIRGRLYAEALSSREPDEVRVVGVADRDLSKLDWAEGIAAFPDHESLLASGEVDALIVATPDFAHFDAVLAGARLKLPMLIEKPLATDLAEADALTEACAGLEVMVGFENRWNPLVRAIQSSMQDAGPVAWQSLELSNTFEVPLRMLSWAGKSSPAWFLMPHSVDLALWIAGSRVVRVDASMSSGVLRSRGVDTTDWFQAQLRFEDGSSTLLTSSWILPDQTSPIVEFRYAGNGYGGSLRADIIRGESDLALPGKDHRELEPEPLRRGDDILTAPAAMVHEFADKLLAGETVAPGVEHGREVTRIIDAIVRSGASGEAVSL